MSVEFYWRLPLHGCHGSLSKDANRGDWGPLAPGRIAPGLRDGVHDGSTYLDHTAEIARAAENAGFFGALVISFPNTEEAWITSAQLARQTKSLTFMVAFQPNFIHPVYAARQAATLQRLSQGRLAWNVITGGGGPGQRWYGDFLPHDDRYTRTREFLEVITAEFEGKPYNYKGKIFQVENGGLPHPFSAEKKPKIFLAGSSDSAIDVAVHQSEFLLNWLEPVDAIKDNIRRAQDKSAAIGRDLKYAIRVDVVARPTEAEAWREIARAWDARVTPEIIAAARAQWGATESVGAARQRAFNPESKGRWEDLKLPGNRWAGFHFLRGGPPVGLVGSYQQVAEQLNDLIDLGVGSLVPAGTPHLEEAYRVGEEILPLLRQNQSAARLAAAE